MSGGGSILVSAEAPRSRGAPGDRRHPNCECVGSVPWLKLTLKYKYIGPAAITA